MKSQQEQFHIERQAIDRQEFEHGAAGIAPEGLQPSLRIAERRACERGNTTVEHSASRSARRGCQETHTVPRAIDDSIICDVESRNEAVEDDVQTVVEVAVAKRNDLRIELYGFP